MAFEYTLISVSNSDPLVYVTLNGLGADGWELVQVMEYGSGWFRYFFKREIPVCVPDLLEVLGELK